MERRCKVFLLYTASAAAVILLFYLAFRYLFWWLLPFLLAFAVCAPMEPVILLLQRRFGFRRGFSAALLTLTLLFLCGGLLSLLLSTLLGEVRGVLTAAPSLPEQLPALARSVFERLERYCAVCPAWLRDYLLTQLDRIAARSVEVLDAAMNALLRIVKDAAAALPRLALGCATTVLAIYFTASAYPELRDFARERLSRAGLQRLRLLRSGAAESLGHWLRAELTLCCVTFCELLLGFLLLRQSFPLLSAFLITLVDALPVFGTGTVLVPWAIGCFLFGNNARGVVLLLLYLVVLCVRSFLEPRLIASRAGLPPLASLLAMYLGFCSCGVAGMIFFPFLLLLGKQVFDRVREGTGQTVSR